MAIICAKCGEELLGSVNRCWKCGQQAVSTPDSGDAPPVRRSPVRLESPTVASLVPARSDESSDEVVTASVFDDVDGGLSRDVSEGAQEDANQAPEDSPDAEETHGPSSAPAPAILTTSPISHKSLDWRKWLPGTSLALGLLAVSFGWLTPWVLIAAVAGVACGVVSVMSRGKKGLAVFALLVCLLGVSVSSVRLAYDAYFFVRGQAITPEDPFLEDDDLDPLEGLEPME